MREILFRAKRIDNGGWVYGQLLKIYNEYYIITKENQHICYHNCGMLEFCDVEEIDPGTIGQYTGLTDRNGNKIYEGDIVDILCEVDELGVIEWDVKTTRFLVSADRFTADFDNYRGTDLEVIDNTFDNPELVGRGSEE